MYSGLNNKLANVPTITGLSNVVADQVVTDTLIVDGNDVGAIIIQVPINTANIATLQQITTGQTYTSVGDTTTFDNNVTLTAGKTMTADNFTGLASNSSQVLVTVNNDATTYYPTFTSGGTGQHSLLFDTTTTPLSYFPSTSTLTCSNLTGLASNASQVLVTENNLASNYHLTFTSPSTGQKSLLIDSSTTPLTYQPYDSRMELGYFQTQENSSVKNLFMGSKNGATIFMTHGVGLPALTTGDFNVIMGGVIGNALVGGSNNFALGYNAFNANINGCNNCIMGHRAALNLGASGNFFTYLNCVVGDTALTNADDVAECTCIGGTSGFSMINGNVKCTCIGAIADCADGLSYATAIGAGAYCTTSNTVQIGRNVDTVNLPVSTITSNALVSSPTLTITDSGTSQVINFIPRAAGSAFNPITAASDSTIYASRNTIGSAELTLTTWSATTCGVRITDTTALIGAGGTGSTPTSSVLFSGTTVTVTGAANFSTNNITVGGASNINFGSGAGSTTNLICGNTNAKSVVFTTGNNTILGGNAGNVMQTTSSDNTFVGNSAGLATTTSSKNTCVGSSAGEGIASGSGENTFVGYWSGFQNTGGTGSANTCVGSSAGTGLTTISSSNVFVGRNCGKGITTGLQHTFIGTEAGNQLSGTGNNNVCIGFQAGTALITTSTQNTITGTIAGNAITTGGGNCIYGFGAAGNLLTGLNNTVIGNSAAATMTGSSNIVIGATAEVYNVGNSNQITIGTATETMFIRGGFNWRIGTQIIATISLVGTVLAQFYSVAMSAASQTITLPTPTGVAYRGAVVTFKRKINTTAFNLASGGTTPFVLINSITPTASPITIAATVFQVDLVSDGDNWCIIGQA